MNTSSNNTRMEFTTPNGSKPEGIDDLYCGEMNENYLENWATCQYWCEGVLFSVIGAIGLLGNLISIFVLVTK